jgi:hypothetical protein
MPKFTAKDTARRDLGRTRGTARCYRRLERQTRAEANCQLDSLSRIFGNICCSIPVVSGRVCRTLALLVLSPAWQSLPVAGLPPADFAGAAS